MENAPIYCTATDIMQLLACSKPLAYEIMRKQPSYICLGKSNHGIRVLRSDVDHWLVSQTAQSRAELQARMYPNIRPYHKRATQQG